MDIAARKYLENCVIQTQLCLRSFDRNKSNSLRENIFLPRNEIVIDNVVCFDKRVMFCGNVR